MQYRYSYGNVYSMESITSVEYGSYTIAICDDCQEPITWSALLMEFHSTHGSQHYVNVCGGATSIDGAHHARPGSVRNRQINA